MSRNICWPSETDGAQSQLNKLPKNQTLSDAIEILELKPDPQEADNPTVCFHHDDTSFSGSIVEEAQTCDSGHFPFDDDGVDVSQSSFGPVQSRMLAHTHVMDGLISCSSDYSTSFDIHNSMSSSVRPVESSSAPSGSIENEVHCLLQDLMERIDAGECCSSSEMLVTNTDSCRSSICLFVKYPYLKILDQPELKYRRYYISDHRGRKLPSVRDRAKHNFIGLQISDGLIQNSSHLFLEVARLTPKFNGKHLYSPHTLVNQADNDATPQNPILFPITSGNTKNGLIKVHIAFVQSANNQIEQPLKCFPSNTNKPYYDVNLNLKRLNEKYQLHQSHLAFTLCSRTNSQQLQRHTETTIISDVLTEQERRDKNKILQTTLSNEAFQFFLSSDDRISSLTLLKPVTIQIQPRSHQRPRSVREQKQTLHFIQGEGCSPRVHPTTEIRPEWFRFFMQVTLVTVRTHQPHVADLEAAKNAVQDGQIFRHPHKKALLFPITEHDVTLGYKEYQVAKIMPYRKTLKNIVGKSELDQCQLCFTVCDANPNGTAFRELSEPSYSIIMKDSFGRLRVQSITPRSIHPDGGTTVKIHFVGGRIRKSNFRIRCETHSGWQCDIRKYTITNSYNVVVFEMPPCPLEIDENVEIIIMQDDEEVARQRLEFLKHKSVTLYDALRKNRPPREKIDGMHKMTVKTFDLS